MKIIIDTNIINKDYKLHGKLQQWNKKFPEKIEECSEVIRQLGYIRIYNDVADLGIRIESIVKSQDLWDQNRHSIKDGWYDEAIFRMVTTTILDLHREKNNLGMHYAVEKLRFVKKVIYLYRF